MMKKTNRIAFGADYLAIPLELLQFFWARKLWWLVPVVIALLLVGALAVLATSSPVAPSRTTSFTARCGFPSGGTSSSSPPLNC